MNKVISFLKDHITLIICIVLGVILFFIGAGISSSGKSSVESAKRTLADINNEIVRYDTELQQINTVIIEKETALSDDRHKSDNYIIGEWILPAFRISTFDEYQAARNLFIDRLPSDHPFLTDFFVEYTPRYNNQHSEYEAVNDGTKIKLNMINGSFVTRVLSVDNNTGTYSYVASFSCDLDVPAGFSGEFKTHETKNKGDKVPMSMVITYDITKDGEIQDFTIVSVA
ncbi:hypothetical protein J6A31_07455 [bacterium]|nr:hypothetical protein [bacterium]